MATDERVKYGNALVTHYLKLWKEKYPGVQKTFNRYAMKWPMMDVVDSVGFERGKELLTYYFRTSHSGHDFQWFIYNFDKLERAMLDRVEDEEKKARMRAETAARVAEWERRQRESRSEVD